MKLPSFHYLLANAKASFIRFPLTIISACVGVAIGIYLTECHDGPGNRFPYINLLLCAALGIPLYFCAVIVCDKMGFEKKIRWIVMLFSTAVLACIYLTLPGSDSTHNTSLPYIKYGIYNITIHLFVSFLPFARSRNLNEYWQYNKILFVRIWVSFLYSGVLYLGLALALGSLKLLFDVHVRNELFFEIYLVVAGLINTWFFVSGIPTDLENLDKINQYPQGLKIFSQYILLPLLAIFLLILYAYGAKILVLWHWPKGLVSNFVIAISVLGILTFLLLHPYAAIAGNGWIRIAARGYYFALAPLLVILFIAIGMRTGEYGVTVSRYVILLLGVWLTILCLYTAAGKTNIKFIPASLAVMLLLMSFGPWGMFSVSERSQVNRLRNILETAGIYKNGKINNETTWIRDSLPFLMPLNKEANEEILNDSLHNEVYSILHYLDGHHGFRSLSDWFHQDIDSLLTIANSRNRDGRSQDYVASSVAMNYNGVSEPDIYMMSMGLKAEQIYADSYTQKSFNYHSETSNLVTVSGYDYMTQIERYEYNNDSLITSVILDSVPYKLFYVPKKDTSLYIMHQTEKIEFPFKTMTEDLKKTYGTKDQAEIPLRKMQINASTEKYDFKAEFNFLLISEKSGTVTVASFNGKLFIRKK